MACNYYKALAFLCTCCLSMLFCSSGEGMLEGDGGRGLSKGPVGFLCTTFLDVSRRAQQQFFVVPQTKGTVFTTVASEVHRQ